MAKEPETFNKLQFSKFVGEDQFVVRSNDQTEFMELVAFMQDFVMEQKKNTPVAATPAARPAYKKSYQKPAPVIPVEGACPLCGNGLVQGSTPSGKKMIKCATAGWDKVNKVATGCEYIEWLQ